MVLSCPLSGSTNISLIERVKVVDIIESYIHLLDDDISSEFQGLKELSLYRCIESDFIFFDPMITGSEAFYEKLQKFDWYYLDEKFEYEYASSFVKPSDFVLEVGCGKGAFAAKIQNENYVGLEFSRRAKEIALSNGVNVLNQSVQEHCASHLAQYNVVCAFQVLEHIADVYSFIRASIDCLKPNGLLICSVPSLDSFISITRNNILNIPPHHVSWWSDKCLIYVGEKFGLEVVEIKHEKLADIHKRWYLSSILLERIRQFLRIKFALIEKSFQYKVLDRMARFGSKLLERSLSNMQVLPDGHSVVVVYRKPR